MHTWVTGVTAHLHLIVATGVYQEYLMCGMKLSSHTFLPTKYISGE